MLDNGIWGKGTGENLPPKGGLQETVWQNNSEKESAKYILMLLCVSRSAAAEGS